MKYMCIPGPTTNVGSFSYILQDIYNNPVASGPIDPYGSDQCIPLPLNVVSPATQLIVTISQTKDGQPPRNVVLDLRGCYISPVSEQYRLFFLLNTTKELDNSFFLSYPRCPHHHHLFR
jgi:hypothetical protein